MNKKTRLLFSCLLALCLSACGEVTETTYERPALATPALWTDMGQEMKERSGAWWQAFNDSTLNGLVEEALLKNNDLASATIKVRRAQLEADLSSDQRLPDLNSSTVANNSRKLTGAQTISRTYETTANVSYELDLWGKLASKASSAQWEALATQQDRESTALTLVGTTIKLYWKTAYLNERVGISEQNIASLKKTLDIVRTRHTAGSVSALEEANAAQTLAAEQAAHTQILLERDKTAHALTILFDAPPALIKANPLSLPPPLSMPKIGAGVPAQLLERRPDLRAAEMRLREYLADTDATRASYLPSFSLTGSLGSSSVALTDMLKNPVGAFGASLSTPFLNFFDMKKNIEISQATFDAAVAAFKQTTYQALSDVEDALAARRRDKEQGDRLQVALDEAKHAETLYALQYKEGYVDLKILLDAEETRHTAEAALLENRFTQITDLITLYEALGGEAKGAL